MLASTSCEDGYVAKLEVSGKGKITWTRFRAYRQAADVAYGNPKVCPDACSEGASESFVLRMMAEADPGSAFVRWEPISAGDFCTVEGDQPPPQGPVMRAVFATKSNKLMRCRAVFEADPSPLDLSITSFDPDHGPPGTSVQITGTGLSASDHVIFGSTPSEMVEPISQGHKAVVPQGATTGKIKVLNQKGQSAQSATDFTVDDLVPSLDLSSPADMSMPDGSSSGLCRVIGMSTLSPSASNATQNSTVSVTIKATFTFENPTNQTQNILNTTKLRNPAGDAMCGYSTSGTALVIPGFIAPQTSTMVSATQTFTVTIGAASICGFGPTVDLFTSCGDMTVLTSSPHIITVQ